MTSELNIEILDDEVVILAGDQVVMGMSCSMAVHTATLILRCVKADDPEALANVERAIRMQDPAGVIADDFADAKLEIECYAEDREVTIWLDGTIVMTLTIDAAQSAAKRLIELGMEIIAAKHPDLAE